MKLDRFYFLFFVAMMMIAVLLVSQDNLDHSIVTVVLRQTKRNTKEKKTSKSIFHKIAFFSLSNHILGLVCLFLSMYFSKLVTTARHFVSN
jgi:hypothetical protein